MVAIEYRIKLKKTTAIWTNNKYFFTLVIDYLVWFAGLFLKNPIFINNQQQHFSSKFNALNILSYFNIQSDFKSLRHNIFSDCKTDIILIILLIFYQYFKTSL